MHIVSTSPQFSIGGLPCSQRKFVVSSMYVVVDSFRRSYNAHVSIHTIVVSWLVVVKSGM